MRIQPGRLRVFAASTILALAAATAAAAASSVRIDNFGRINANYYRGAQPVGEDYADLAALGVKTIIDLTSDDAQPSERQNVCLLYTSPSPRDGLLSRMPSSA